MHIFFDVDYTLLGARDLSLRPGTREVFRGCATTAMTSTCGQAKGSGGSSFDVTSSKTS